jgi:hypothetical protein
MWNKELLPCVAGVGKVFLWKRIWRVRALPWVAFFSWCLALEQILTADNLRKRAVVIVEWCFMCKNHKESE